MVALVGCRSEQPRMILTPTQATVVRLDRPPPGAAETDDFAVSPTAVKTVAPNDRSGAGTWREFGRSVSGRPLRLFELTGGGPATLIFGGIHGSEPESADLAERLARLLTERPEAAGGRQVLIAPVVNPDGLRLGTRTNVRGVDLNRNFPATNWIATSPVRRFHPGPSPASEPETRALVNLVETVRPARIISIHSVSGGRHCNNYDGPAAAIAQVMARHNGYRVTDSWDTPTPGSFGSWAGVDAQSATLTLERPFGEAPEVIWQRNREALLAAIRADTPVTSGM
jgi:hypothetical protein